MAERGNKGMAERVAVERDSERASRASRSSPASDRSAAVTRGSARTVQATRPNPEVIERVVAAIATPRRAPDGARSTPAGKVRRAPVVVQRATATLVAGGGYDVVGGPTRKKGESVGVIGPIAAGGGKRPPQPNMKALIGHGVDENPDVDWDAVRAAEAERSRLEPVGESLAPASSKDPAPPDMGATPTGKIATADQTRNPLPWTAAGLRRVLGSEPVTDELTAVLDGLRAYETALEALGPDNVDLKPRLTPLRTACAAQLDRHLNHRGNTAVVQIVVAVGTETTRLDRLAQQRLQGLTDGKGAPPPPLNTPPPYSAPKKMGKGDKVRKHETMWDRYKTEWGLNDKEITALQLYTTSVYKMINPYLRGNPTEQYRKKIEEFVERSHPAVASFDEFIRLITSAMAKLPKYKTEGHLSRGVGLESHAGLLEQYEPGKPPIADSAFMSTTFGVPFAKDSIVVLDIPPGHAGVNIAQYSKFEVEEEVLFPPGTKVKVLHTLEKAKEQDSFDSLLAKLVPVSETRFGVVKRIVYAKVLPAGS